MGVRIGRTEEIVVEGTREEWLEKCKNALERGKFSQIKVFESLFELTAKYNKFTTSGSIKVTLMPFDEKNIKIVINSSANYDNIFVLFKSPNKTIIQLFKNNLNRLDAEGKRPRKTDGIGSPDIK